MIPPNGHREMDGVVIFLYETRMGLKTIYHESLHHVPEEGWTNCAFSVLRAGKIAAAPDYAIERSRQIGQDLLFCISGAGIVHSSGRQIEVEAGQVAWIANETPHGHSAHRKKPWTLLWLRLDGPNPPALRKKLFRDNVSSVAVRDTPVLMTWFERLFSAMRLREPGLDIRLNQFVAELMTILDQAIAGSETHRAPLLLLGAIAAMRTDLGRLWSAEDLSQLMGLSSSQIRRLFQKHLRMSPRQWLLRERLIHAQSLMVGSAAPLAEVAESCGFCDVYHFSREFKRSVGITPAAWRRGELSVKVG
jgi:AraC-like DNA-binding protein